MVGEADALQTDAVGLDAVKPKTENRYDMAFTELEIRHIEAVVGSFIDERRPPLEIRDKLDLGYRIRGQSVEIFEIRPRFQGKPGETMEHSVAKTTYVRTQKYWRIFWLRADLKWHSYQPDPQVDDIEDFVDIVDGDEYKCFFG